VQGSGCIQPLQHQRPDRWVCFQQQHGAPSPPGRQRPCLVNGSLGWPGELEHAPLSPTGDRDHHAVVAARSHCILDLESPPSTQPVNQGRQRSDPCPTLDAGLGSELHRLQHPIKLGEPWIPIVGCSIGLSATYPTLFHAAMVGRDRARLAGGPSGSGAAAPPLAAVSTGCDRHVA
jgi:hypothetical protein